MSKYPSGFRHVGEMNCGSCRFLGKFPTSGDFECSKHKILFGLEIVVKNYVCDYHKPIIGKWIVSDRSRHIEWDATDEY